MSLLFHPAVELLLVAIWGICVYAIVRKNEKAEHLEWTPMPIGFLAFVGCAAMLTLVLLRAPWNFSVAIATVGFGMAAYSDFKTRYLWDEAIVSTIFLCGGIMILGKQGTPSIVGGILCGMLASVVHFGGMLFGKDTGYGDVKLAAGIGFALGPIGGVAAYFIGVLLMSGGLVIASAINKKSITKASQTPVAFGPALTGGMLSAAAMLPYFGAFR